MVTTGSFGELGDLGPPMSAELIRQAIRSPAASSASPAGLAAGSSGSGSVDCGDAGIGIDADDRPLSDFGGMTAIIGLLGRVGVGGGGTSGGSIAAVDVLDSAAAIDVSDSAADIDVPDSAAAIDVLESAAVIDVLESAAASVPSTTGSFGCDFRRGGLIAGSDLGVLIAGSDLRRGLGSVFVRFFGGFGGSDPEDTVYESMPEKNLATRFSATSCR
jgi:hypothetical protein